MKHIDARRACRIEVIETLKAAGILDGLSLQAAQLHNETRPCFWRGVVRDDAARSKDVFVTWHIPSSDAATRADDNAFLREVTVAVDVFSKRSFDSEQNHKIIERIEGGFAVAGFEVDMAAEQFEADTKLFHQPMTLFKLYGGQNVK